MNLTHYEKGEMKMKKVLKITGWVFGGFLALGIIGSTLSDDEPGTKTEPAKVVETTAPVKKETPKVETPKVEVPKEEKPKENTFVFGAEAVFDSGLVVKAVSVTETAERNQFAEPANFVVVVAFEFTNNTNAEITLTSYDFKVVDSAGFQGVDYPQGDQLVTVAPGTKARGNFHYGVEVAGPYKVIGGVATWQ
jgi:hypothetical protein